jgi:WD40 repeat protein
MPRRSRRSEACPSDTATGSRESDTYGPTGFPRHSIQSTWIVAWSPTGDKLAIGDHEGKIRTYETSTWTFSFELDGPRSYVRFIAWSPDGKALATGDDAGTLWVWDAVSGKRLIRCSPHSQNIGVAALDTHIKTGRSRQTSAT